MRIILADSKALKNKAKALGMLKSWASLALDTETKGNMDDIFSMELIMLQLGNGEDQIIIDCREVDPKPFLQLIKHKTIIGHNLKFDVAVIYLNTGIELRNLWDTMLAAIVLECGDPEGSYSLKNVTRRYVDANAYSEEDEATKDVRTTFLTWEGPFTDEQIAYGALDIKYTYRCYEVLEFRLRHDDLIDTARHEFEFLNVVVEMELSGMPFDSNMWLTNAHESTNKAELLLQELRMIADINWNSPKQVIEVFKANGISTSVVDKDSGTIKQSVNVNVLIKQKGDHPLLITYLAYKKAKKLSSAYGHKFLRFINPTTRRIHTSIRQILETGRTAATDPNLQQVPRESQFRSCFKAPEGRTFVLADYSNQELRVLADKAYEPAMLDAFIHGRDIHLETARLAFDDPTLEKDSIERQMAKSMNFLMAYGGGAHKLADAFGLTIAKAKELIDKYYATFSALAVYFEKVGQDAVDKGYILIDDVIRRKSKIEGYKKFIEDWEHVDYYGVDSRPTIERRYRITKSKIQRDSQNRPIQGTSANISKEAGIMLQKARKESGLDFKILLLIHDEWVLECKETDAPQVAKLLSEVMEKASIKYLKHISIPAESKITNRWVK